VTPANQSRLRLFGTAYLQVLLVAANTVFIANHHLFAIALTALLISYVWTHNVTKIAIGREADRWVYATGAALGALCGAMLARALL
jgi:hypothetical protein